MLEQSDYDDEPILSIDGFNNEKYLCATNLFLVRSCFVFGLIDSFYCSFIQDFVIVFHII